MDFTPEGPSVSTSRIAALRSQRTPKPQVSNTLPKLQLDDSSFVEEGMVSDRHGLDDIINQCLSVGDFASAIQYIDMKYAVDSDEEDGEISKLANHIKLLSQVQEWTRIKTILEENKLYTRHLFFAYFYVSALFHLHLYPEIPSAPLGNLLKRSGFSLKYFNLVDGADIGMSFGDHLTLSLNDETLLDVMAESLKIHSKIMLVYGRTFLILEHRDAACNALQMSFSKDRSCMLAQHLLLKHKLLDMECHLKLLSLHDKHALFSNDKDPRVRASQAEEFLSRGQAKEALQITQDVMSKHGIYMDCLLTHIAALTQLEDADTLFLLAHRLVDSLPDHEYSWYAVSLYYYVCKNNQAAKNFMNKATMMNNGFGEGWLAYGHILSAESENEQALNCYYRASRILERHFEPLLYIAKQYLKSGVKLADQFLEDASKLAPKNPIVVHEQGTLSYNKNDFPNALMLFQKALRLVIDGEDAMDTPARPNVDHQLCRRIANHPIDKFWESLINNLGHCCRRLGYNDEAIEYHFRALSMNPRNPQCLLSIGMSYAANGDMEQAVVFFHKSLAVSPHDDYGARALESLVQLSAEYVHTSEENDENSMSMEELKALLETKTPDQEKAKEIAKTNKRAKRTGESYVRSEQRSQRSRHTQASRQVNDPATR